MTDANIDEVDFDENEDDGLTLDDLSSGFISNPAVDGPAVEFTVDKVKKLTGTSLIGKKSDGTTFTKNLSNVEYGYEVITSDASKYTVSSWEVFGKMKAILNKLKTIKGVKLRLTHILDGMIAANKKKDKYIVEAFVEGEFKSLDRDSKEWKTE